MTDRLYIATEPLNQTDVVKSSRALGWFIATTNRPSPDQMGGMAVAPWFGSLLLAFLAFSTFGLPVLLGLSWLPSPAGSGSSVPQYPAALDVFSFVHVDWPWRVLEANQLRQGHLPTWNSYSSLGLPFAAQYQNQIFFPVEWIEIFGGQIVWNLLLIGKMVIAGLGTYLVLRRMIRNDLPALLGAALYMFSAYFLWLYPIAAFVNSAALLPWLFWGIFKLRDRNARMLPAVGITGLVIGLMALAGQPQIALLNVAGGVAYLVGGGLSSKVSRFKTASGLLVVSLTLGLGIAGIQLRVFEEAVGQGYTIHSAGAYADTGTSILNYTLPVWPFLMGQLMAPWNGSLFPGRLNWEAFPVVTGTSGLFLVILAFVGLASGMRRSHGVPRGDIWTMAVLLASILGVVMSGSLGFRALWSQPGLDRVNFPRYISPVLSFTLAALVAWGVASLGEMTRRRLGVVNLIVLLASVVALIIVVPQILNAPEEVDRAYLSASILLALAPFLIELVCINCVLLTLVRGKTTLIRAQLALFLCVTAELSFFVRYGLGIDDEGRRLLVFVLWAGSSLLVIAKREALLLLSLPAAEIAILSILALAPHRLAKAEDPFASPPAFVQFLNQRLGEGSKQGRILATRDVTIPNVLSAWGIAQLDSLNPVQVRSTAGYIFDRLASKPISYTVPNAWWGMSTAADSIFWTDYFTQRRYYNLVGVKFLVDTPGGWLTGHPQDGIRLAYKDGNVHIYEDTHALPRAIAVDADIIAGASKGGLEALPRRDDPLTYMQASTFPARSVSDPAYRPLFVAVDPTTGAAILVWQRPDGRQYREPDGADTELNYAILKGTPSGELASGLLLTDVPKYEALEISLYSNERVDLEARLDRPVVAILTDAYYPGWKAYVDGGEQPILHVDSIVRGVIVQAGVHQVSFRYEPDYFLPWLAVSTISAVVALGLILVPARRKRLDRRADVKNGPAAVS